MNPTNLELLRLAKELAYSDYNNRKSELHNQWLAESDIAWKKHRLKVSYPPIPPFPSEAEIVNRALNLINFLNTPRPDIDKATNKDEIKEAVTAGEVIPEDIKPEEEVKEVKSENKQETPVEKNKESKPNLPLEQDLAFAKLKVQKRQGDDSSRELVGSLVKKLSELKNAWK